MKYIVFLMNGGLILFYLLRIIYQITKAKFFDKYKMISTDKHFTIELIFYYLCVILVCIIAIYNRL